jgi:hypothetical protein
LKDSDGAAVTVTVTALLRAVVLPALYCAMRRHAPVFVSVTVCISKALWDASKGKVGGAFSGLTGFARDIKESLLALLKLRKGEE